MIKHLISGLIILLGSFYVKAQGLYDINKIPENLKQNASIVIRNEETFFDVKSLGNAQQDYKIAITILNEAGSGYAQMVEGYDKFSNIYNIKAAIYDAAGKKIKDYKSSDIIDQSSSDGFSIYSDNRIKKLDFQSNAYPFTIEYSYSQDFKGILDYPSWQDVRGFNIAVEKSSYTIQQAKGNSFRYITNQGLKTDSTKVGEKMQFKWKSENQSALVYEPLVKELKDVANWVLASSNDFEFDGTKGSLRNWEDFGMWFYKLNEGGNVLPELLKTKVKSLVREAKTPKDKIRVLYNYLQQNTRYVSIQLGIGGFKPILAEKVAQVNYGDCKALSNYMKALLNEAGIASNLVVIGNDMPSLKKDFASNSQSNHMILCVPLENDTTYLECTSQYKPMGFIGYGNSDRDVLLITEQGGKVVHTPVYTAKDNFQIRTSKITFNEDLSAEINIQTNYGNAQFEDNFSLLLQSPTEQRKALIQRNDIAGAELVSFKLEQSDKDKPIMTDELKFKSNQLLNKGGDRLFLVLNQTNRKESVPAKVENRKISFSIPFSYNDEDQIIYQLPKGYSIEFLPKTVQIDTEFGTYQASFEKDGDKIIYKRKQLMIAKDYAALKYNEYVDFYKKIYQADKLKAILTKL